MVGPRRWPFAKFNPVTASSDAACRQFERDAKRLDALSGLRMLDIGCGSVLSEPLAARNRRHRGGSSVISRRRSCMPTRLDFRGLPRDHSRGTRDAGERFDIVLAMEVVEHVADLSLFVRRCAGW
jgi:2-polyprenyl-6-hydroxyphenyl methylase/3-demethylubiquinone-9 3-methyltransferase